MNMIAKKLSNAFKFTDEEYASTFERFANAFLLPDYPELDPVGGKKDKGMDARIVQSDTGKNLLVVQSCVSPPKKARSKILNTVKKLEENPPVTLIYATPATIGLSLDETKKELRQNHHIQLEVFDATWFIQRAEISDSRKQLADSYSSEILAPFFQSVDPKNLYSEVLTETEERKVIQYLEAHNRDRKQGSNLTKSIFNTLITYALRDSEATTKRYNQNEILESICKIFPVGHHPRIHEIVPPLIARGVKKGKYKYHKSDESFALSFNESQKLSDHLSELANQEIMIRASIFDAIDTAVEKNNIDYEFDRDQLMSLIHKCILWYMQEQGKQLQDPAKHILNVLNTEELMLNYLSTIQQHDSLTQEVVMDIAPTALYLIISTENKEIRQYLRSKSDVFIAQTFLQSTPDVQKAFSKLFGKDTIYVDTTVLINCTSELYTINSPQLLLSTLKTARKLGIRVKTFQPFVDEFVAHLKGPVLLEWKNHFQGKPFHYQESRFNAAPILVQTFSNYEPQNPNSVSKIIDTILGDEDQIANATEYIHEEFHIETETIPAVTEPTAQGEWEYTLKKWKENKRRHKRISQQRFETLVKNDVDAYSEICRLRSEKQNQEDHYGHKFWLLTLDRMYWRIPSIIGQKYNYLFNVAMSMDYLANYVATLANMDAVEQKDIILPASLISYESEIIPFELIDTVTVEWETKDIPRYQKRRNIRKLVQEAKTSGWEMDQDIDIISNLQEE